MMRVKRRRFKHLHGDEQRSLWDQSIWSIKSIVHCNVQRSGDRNESGNEVLRNRIQITKRWMRFNDINDTNSTVHWRLPRHSSTDLNQLTLPNLNCHGWCSWNCYLFIEGFILVLTKFPLLPRKISCDEIGLSIQCSTLLPTERPDEFHNLAYFSNSFIHSCIVNNWNNYYYFRFWLVQSNGFVPKHWGS